MPMFALRRRHLALPVLAMLALCAIITPCGAQPSAAPVTARHGMVASDHQLASDAGARIMKQGGNAVDAAIATALALAVVHPSAGNVGGGGFLVYCDGQGLATTYDFRETAPAAATERMFLDEHGAVRDTSNHVGPLAVGTPGTVAGLWLAHQRHGRLPWAALVQPAIDLAQGGFPLSPGMSDWCDRLAKTTSPLYAATRAAFLDTDGRPLLPGTTLRQPDLAATLTRIRDHGRDGFYKGETARLLAAFMRDHGGLITEADLAAYQAVERDPVRGTYRGYDIIGMGPPSSGGTAIIEMLNMLEGEDVAKLQTGTAPYLHLLSEVMRRAYADRAQFMGDPDFNDAIPLERLLSKAHAAKLRATIDPARATPSDSSRFGAAWLPHESEQTTHLSVVDAAGGAVSLTYTLEETFGSGLVAPGTGFILNNEMGDFNAIPGRTDRNGAIGTAPNLVAPGKRMLSSMSPVIVTRGGAPVLVIGSPGGRTIINTVLQVMLNVIDHDLDIRAAVEAPRIHHQWLPDVTQFEARGFAPEERRRLEAMGHALRKRPVQGCAMGIVVDPGTGLRSGAADSRSVEGGVAGY
jgi:gamma-glutamyltranspeptidase/glutathione hydrolase